MNRVTELKKLYRHMKLKHLYLFLLLLIVFPKNGWAHEVRPGYLQIIQVTDSTYHMYWKVPRMGDKTPPCFTPRSV